MLSTPLGVGAKGGGARNGGKGDCNKCGGMNHKAAQCPNIESEKSESWKKKPEEVRKRRCDGCKGVGHWKYHHSDSYVEKNHARIGWS